MDYFAGLDVSVKETSICVVDDTGRIVREAKVANIGRTCKNFRPDLSGQSACARESPLIAH